MADYTASAVSAFNWRGQTSIFSKSKPHSAAKERASIALAKKSLAVTPRFSINTEKVSGKDKTYKLLRGSI